MGNIFDYFGGNTETHRLLRRLLERVMKMPTIDEVKAAVADAVAKEREQVRLAIIKAVEDALKNATISDADEKAILDAIASVYEPSPPTPTP